MGAKPTYVSNNLSNFKNGFSKKDLDVGCKILRSGYITMNAETRKFEEAFAKKLNVKMLIDAEESWVQNAIDEIAEDLMEVFNKEKAYIFTTLQLYRKDRLKYLHYLFSKANRKDFRLGIKLVRGAYIEKENKKMIVKIF